MVREATEHAEEDRKRREDVETRNQAEALTFQAERTLKDLGDKVSPEDRAAVESKVSDVRNALKTEGPDVVKDARDRARRDPPARRHRRLRGAPGRPGDDGAAPEDGTEAPAERGRRRRDGRGRVQGGLGAAARAVRIALQPRRRPPPELQTAARSTDVQNGGARERAPSGDPEHGLQTAATRTGSQRRRREHGLQTAARERAPGGDPEPGHAVDA